MKKKLVFVVVLVILVVAGFIWWKLPVKFLNGLDAKDIDRIEVMDRTTGNEFVIKAKEDISYIVTNIQNIEMDKHKLSIGYMGTRFDMSFYDKSNNLIDEFIINADDAIRKDPIFYNDSNAGLCVDYIENIEQNQTISD